MAAGGSGGYSETSGRFFEDRFKAIPLIDEQAIAACAVYIDLNLIRACIAETVELADHASGKLRAQVFQAKAQQSACQGSATSHDRLAAGRSVEVDAVDAFLSPVSVSAYSQEPGVMASNTGKRCSDKGFLEISAWLKMVANFGTLLPTMPGLPRNVEGTRSRKRSLRHHVPLATRELFAQCA